MKVVLQRVQKAAVTIDGEQKSAIGRGLLLLVGIAKGDTSEIVSQMAGKIVKMRVFPDRDGKMNLSLREVRGEVLSVSQFTLLGNTNKGNRPGFDTVAPPEEANALWKEFNRAIKDEGISVSEGEFGAHMVVDLTNDGPVTFVLERM